MRKGYFVCLIVLLAGLVVFSTADSEAQGRRGGGPGGVDTPGVPKVVGPLSTIMGPTDVVRDVRGPEAYPLAPTTDTYYSIDAVNPIMDPMEWVVDEFISNPDGEFDWRDLKSWHYVPLPKSLTILGRRKIQAGESVAFEATVEDLTGTQSRVSLSYFGPHGRRSTYSASLTPVAEGSPIMRGQLTTNEWTEPGVYYLTYMSTSNESRSSKVFHSDHVPFMRGMEFEVLPNPDADVIPPVVEWVKVNTLSAEEDEIRTQRVQEAIPVFAKVTDNKSGVGNIKVRFVTPEGKFIEANLHKVIGQEDVYGAMLTVPQWWGGGEYELLSMWAQDKAGKTSFLFRTTHPVLENAVVNMTQDDTTHDETPPTLFSVWIDKTEARLGEEVTVSVIITDDMSGVGTVAVNFTPIPSYIDRVIVHLKPVDITGVIQKSGLDVSENLWTGTVATTEWMEPGEWKIDRIMARDNADNYLDLLPEYVPEIDTIRLTYTGGHQLREQMRLNRAGQQTAGIGPGVSQSVAPAGKIRRMDMTPPHPPRGYCLNCHEP